MSYYMHVHVGILSSFLLITFFNTSASYDPNLITLVY